MYLTINSKKWCVRRSPSAFIPRNGKDDVRIMVEGTWGERHEDNKLYHSCCVRQAENGEIIRQYETVPPIFTVAWLRENGFVDSSADMVEYVDLTHPLEEIPMGTKMFLHELPAGIVRPCGETIHGQVTFLEPITRPDGTHDPFFAKVVLPNGKIDSVHYTRLCKFS